METATVAPPASAPAAAPTAPASAPAPAAPAATTPETPAPSPAVTPETTTPEAEPSSDASIHDRLAEGWKKAKEAVVVEGEESPEAEAGEAPAPGEEPETPEAEAAPEATPEGETPAEAAPAEEWDLEDAGDPGDPAAFFAEANKNPEVKKFFDDNQQLKNQVAGALRRDKENREIRQYVPDVETAKIVTGAAATFQAIDNKFLQATTPDGAQAFLDHWIKEAMYVDDKGQPILENGKYKLHPALTYVFDHIFNNKLSVLADQAKTAGNERLQVALDVIKEALTPSSSAEDEIPEALKPYAERLKAKETALSEKEQADERQRQADRQVAHLQSIERAELKAVGSVKAQLEPRFKASGLSSFEQNSALQLIGEQIDQQLGHQNEDGSWAPGNHPSSRLFQSIYDSILQNHPPGEEREKRLTKHILSYTQPILGPIVSKVIRDAKQGTVSRQVEKQNTVDSQKRVSATEPRGTSIAPSTAAPQNPAELRAQVIKDLTAKLGREPDLGEITAEAWKRSQAPRK